MNLRKQLGLSALILFTVGLCAHAAEPPSPGEAARALHGAVTFFRDEVAVEGSYLWRYSADLNKREGEGKADAQTGWVQPPGTPYVGEAYLFVYESTGDSYYLDAARETAQSLIRTQLQSGGWTYRIHFDAENRARQAYRADGRTEGQNVSTLDDDTTQSALRFLMKVDRATDFSDASLHEAVLYGLDALTKVQYPNGAWPQRFHSPPDPAKFPIKKAEYPESWSRDYVKNDYTSYYTFNDNTIADTIQTFLDAADVYGISLYRDTALKGGQFILLAQMPDPQPAWAQQYDADMHPAWARKFEPPAVTGGESQGAVRTLIMLASRTGEKRFLEPIPQAIAYLRTSQLPDGRLARFYELETNRPLYFTLDYQLTYSSDNMPTHYSFIVGSSLDEIEAVYKKVAAADFVPPSKTMSSRKAEMTDTRIDMAREAVASLDERGAWIEDGRLRYHGDEDDTRRVIDCRTFVQNIRALASFVGASR